MRKLMWFAIGFTAACAVGVYLIAGNWLLLLALFSAAATAGMALLRHRVKVAKVIAVMLAGCCIGCCWFWGFDSFYLKEARSLDGQKVYAQITVTDYSQETDNGAASDGTLTLNGRTYRVRVYVNEHGSLKPGDLAEGSFRLRFTADGGEKEPTYHQGKGIFLLAFATNDLVLTPSDTPAIKYFAATLRNHITDMLDAVFPEDTLAFARALLLGDSSKLTYAQDTDFKVSGIHHVIAVSGLHVAILFSLLHMMAGKRWGLTAILGIPVLVVFAAIAGFTPSINRACIMQVLIIVAMLFDKEYDPPTALAFSVLVMLAVNPLTITSVSFQLSVGCMVGIFMFSDKIHDFLMDKKRLGPAKGKSLKAVLTRWFVGSVSVTLSAMLVTTPLCAWYFGMVSLIGAVTNLLTLWVISFVFYGIMAACAAGFLWLPLGKGIAWIVSWPMRYVLLISKMLASVPLAAVYTRSIYIVIWLIGCYALFVIFLLSKKKRPVLLAACAVFGLVLSVTVSWVEPRMDPYRVTVMDVGQGQCILLQSQGENFLIDCGGDDDEQTADIAAQTLLSQGIGHLDGLVLTHYDRDHAGGVVPLLSRIPADRIYLPTVTDANGIREKITAEHAEYITWIDAETEVGFGGVKLTLIPSEDLASDNESSMCILFQAENCDILITGDRSSAGERQLLAQTTLPALEVLIVGHHGSKLSTSMELLNATKPAAAVISVGKENPYGHPSQEALERLGLYGCRVWRTDLHGTILFRG